MDVGSGYLPGLGFKQVAKRSMSINQYEVLKDLIIAEDRVFGDRMNIFLVVNSLMLLSVAQIRIPGFIVPILGIILDLIWLYVGSLTLSAHNFWRDELIKIEKETLGEKTLQEGIFTKRRQLYPKLGKLTRLSATETLTYILPSAFLLMWVYLLAR